MHFGFWAQDTPYGFGKRQRQLLLTIQYNIRHLYNDLSALCVTIRLGREHGIVVYLSSWGYDLFYWLKIIWNERNLS